MLDQQNEIVLTESRYMRDEYVFKDNVLERVKAIPVLAGTLEVTVEMAANFYEVPYETVRKLIQRSRAEFNEYSETRVVRGRDLAALRCLGQDVPTMQKTSVLTLISRRGLLRIGMLLTESEVARSVRNYLLNVEEIADNEQRQWAVGREITKRERRRLTDAIQTYYRGSLKGKPFEYATFTNLVYRTLFDTDATGMRKAYALSEDEPLRDALSTEDLRKVVDVESTIGALVRLGKDYGEIRDELLARKSVFRGDNVETSAELPLAA